MRLSLVFGVLLLAGCSEPRATVEIVDVRARRDVAVNRIAVEVDILGREGLGGSVGPCCVRAAFVGQTIPTEACRIDVGDGDLATIRLWSDGYVPPKTPIGIRARVGVTDTGASVETP